jgi:PAS domain S-box-containing protein
MAARPIRYILTFQSALVALVPFIIAAILGFFWLYPQIRSDLQARQYELAKAISSEIDSYLTSAMVSVASTAGINLDNNLNWHNIQHVLNAQINSSASLQAIYAATPNGHIRAVGLLPGREEQFQNLVGIDLSRNPLFAEVVKSRSRIWSDTFLSIMGGGISVALAIPARDMIVIGEINLERLTKLLRHITSQKNQIIFIIDRHGQVVADQDGRFTAQQLNISNIPLIREVMADKSPRTGNFEFEGKSMTGSIMRIPTIDWYILVAQPTRDAFSPVVTTIRIVAAGLVAELLLGIMVALYISRKMSLRFEKLAEHARVIASGKEAPSWSNARILEFEQLAENLQMMSKAIREREQDLEHQLSDQRRAEAQIKYLQNYLSNIIDSMPAVLVGIDTEDRITFWNRSAQALTGFSQESAMGQRFTTLLPDFASAISNLRDEIKLHQPATLSKFLIDSEEARHFFDIILFPVSDNETDGAVIMIENITEKSRVEEMMIQAEKMMSVGGLAAGMAHEINNPLGIILQAAQNIERRVSADLPVNRQVADETGIAIERVEAYFHKRQIPEFISSIKEASNRAAKIVNNLIKFSTNNESAMKPNSLVELLEQTLDLAANDYDLKKKFEFRSIKIVREFSVNIPPVPMIATEIEQVLLNLLKNAAQALISISRERERLPCLVIRLYQDERYAIIEIEDNGPGMTDEVRRRIFEPFFTTKDPGIGTGLGLSVSYMIITRNHKGRLEVASTPGSGTLFTISLPLRQEPLPASHPA